MVYVSIGSNINPLHYICQCLDALSNQYGEITTSSVYQSDSVGFEGNAFFNLVAGFNTDEPVDSLYHRLRSIEDENQRDRSQPRFSDRTLDIDILIYNDLHQTQGSITLPHPDIIAYAYVLVPLAELSPELIIPGTSLTVQQCSQASNHDPGTLEVVNFCWRHQPLPLRLSKL